MNFYIKSVKTLFPWNKKVRGLVLWPFIFLKPYKAEEFAWKGPTEAEAHAEKLNNRLYRHELEHCYQIKKMGVIRFYIRYVLIFLRSGYRKHPYEIEAYNTKNTPLTDEEREWLVNRKVKL